MAVSTEQIAKVLNELHQSQGESSAAQMFLKALPHLFGGEKHKFQVKLIEMLRDTLKRARATHAENQAAMVKSVSEIEALLGTKRQEEQEAENREKEARETVEAKAAILSEKKQATKAEEALLAEAQKTKDSVEQDRRWYESSKAEVDSILTGSMQVLVQGGVEGEEANDFVRAVCEYLQSMGVDKVLLASLPKALGCSLDNRGSFSKLAIDTAHQQLVKRSSELQQKLEEGAEKFEQVSAERLGAWAIADVARDTEREATEAKANAEAVLSNAVSEVKVAKDKVVETELDLNRILSEQTLVESKVQDIDSAMAEIVRLETEADKENEDIVMPAAKRMKTGDAEVDAITLEAAPMVSVQ